MGKVSIIVQGVGSSYTVQVDKRLVIAAKNNCSVLLEQGKEGQAALGALYSAANDSGYAIPKNLLGLVVPFVEKGSGNLVNSMTTILRACLSKDEKGSINLRFPKV